MIITERQIPSSILGGMSFLQYWKVVEADDGTNIIGFFMDSDRF